MATETICGYGKQSWPELVGEQVSVAVETIHRENPNVQAVLMPPGTVAVTLDYNCGRVRVFARRGIVSRVPQVG
ncbi:hypothetical protein Sjap_003581 [Stephania japonica]|uniref:Uncharacterized protein n=1 Tax=Stephania japonica TaxID=461633 RepID=A0AAP0PXA5_9MAGN